MTMHTRRLAMGLATYVPGASRFANMKTGGSDSARYCYSVWLRHLVSAQGPEFSGVPVSLAEIGPGDSLGLGIAAMLCGTDSYVAFDVAPYAATDDNLRILDELIALFARREPIPDDAEFPDVGPCLPGYAFPGEVLGEASLAVSLAPGRLTAMRALIADGSLGTADGLRIHYEPRWTDPHATSESVEMVCSQAVLEHVDDLDAAYAALRRWIAPGGVMSHHVDFTSHGTARVWNGHWTFSDREWRLVRGRRRWFLNREPLGTHERLLRDHGFRITDIQRGSGPSPITRDQVAPRFAGTTDEDLGTYSAYIRAVPAPG